jgi:hypothetical protein
VLTLTLDHPPLGLGKRGYYVFQSHPFRRQGPRGGILIRFHFSGYVHSRFNDRLHLESLTVLR